MKWEYRVHSVPAEVVSKGKMRPKELEQILNGHGAEGWELVSAFATTDDSDQFVLTFKRPIDDATAAPARSR